MIKLEHSMLFLYRFDAEVIEWYKRGGCGEVGRALQDVSEISGTMLYRCERVGQDGGFGALMGVVCQLEERGGGEVRLGGFM